MHYIHYFELACSGFQTLVSISPKNLPVCSLIPLLSQMPLMLVIVPIVRYNLTSEHCVLVVYCALLVGM